MSQLSLNVRNNIVFRVRTGLRAGRTVCYQLVDGGWVPVLDSNKPLPLLPAPTPAPPPGVQVLDCQSCTGSELTPGVLTNAHCEVCFL